MLKLDYQTLLHLRGKGIANDLNRFCGRNVLWCVGDGGRGVCSSDVHRLVQKPVSAGEMQFTHATRSPRASQIAGRVVCGSKVDIVAGISARDSVAMEKFFDKPPASYCITHERTYLLSPSRKEERKTREKGERRKEKGERSAR